MKGSIIVVSFFIAGILCGIVGRNNEFLGGVIGLLSSPNVSFCALCGLLLCVGMSIGSNPNMMSEFRSLNFRLLFLPLFTILGSWAGAALAFVFLHRGLPDLLAVGSGFAYYSLSSIFITSYKSVELGTIALLANIFRELFTLLGTPLIYKVFGPLAPISAGGATTMDTTLPIIMHTVGKKYSVVAIYHGFVVDFSVPFLVTFWCMV